MRKLLVLSLGLLASGVWGQNAVERQGGTLSLGTGYHSLTALVKSGSTVTAGHAVKLDSASAANQVIECSPADIEFLGIAASTVAGDGVATVEVATHGVIAAVPENNTTVGHIAGIGTSTAGNLRDLGQTTSSAVRVGVKIAGKWLQAVTGNGTNTALLQLYGPGHFGAQVQAVDAPATPLTAGTSVTLTGPRGYYVCTGTCAVTLPTPAAGYEFCVFDDDNVTTAITFQAATGVSYEKPDHSGYGSVNGTLASTAGTWARACVIGRDSTHWLVASSQGTWTAN